MLLNASLLLLLPLLALAEVTPPTTVAVDEALHLLVFSILHVLKSIKSLATLPAVVIVALITPISMQPAPNSSRYHDSSSTHHLTNDLSNLRNTRAAIRFVWVMVKVCKFIILAQLVYPLNCINSFYNFCFMFHIFKKISFHL
jgi:hypothetical protein